MRTLAVLTMMAAVSGCGLQLDNSGKKSNALNGDTSDQEANMSPGGTTDGSSCTKNEPNEMGCDTEPGAPNTTGPSCGTEEIDENLCNLDLKEAIATCIKAEEDCSELLQKLKLYESMNYCELRQPEPPPQESDCEILSRLIADCEKAGDDCSELYRKRDIYASINHCKSPPPDDGPN
jgi:hypothetical protein